MRFSIVIPAYNAGTFLDECLESVTRQSFSDFEVVVIDDGSTDNTSELADFWSKEDSRVSVIHKNNQGLLLARRDGVLNSKGDYIVFLDADDMLNQQTLQICSRIIDKYKPDLIVYGMANDINYKVSVEKEIVPSGYFDDKSIDDLKWMLCQGKIHSMCGKAIKRSCFTDKIPYEKYSGLMHGEDFLQSIYLFDNISSAYVLNERLYYYRPNTSASTSGYKKSQLQDLGKVLFELEKKSTEWGNRFCEAAFVGEALQICYLLRLLINGELPLDEKRNELLKFSGLLKALGCSVQRINEMKIRPDQKVMLYACMKGNIYLLKTIIRLTDKIRKLAGSYR